MASDWAQPPPPPVIGEYDWHNLRPSDGCCTICRRRVGRKLYQCTGRPEAGPQWPAAPLADVRWIPCPDRHWVCTSCMGHNCSQDVPDSVSIRMVRRGCWCIWKCQCAPCIFRANPAQPLPHQLLGLLAPPLPPLHPPPVKANAAQPPLAQLLGPPPPPPSQAPPALSPLAQPLGPHGGIPLAMLGPPAKAANAKAKAPPPTLADAKAKAGGGLYGIPQTALQWLNDGSAAGGQPRG